MSRTALGEDTRARDLREMTADEGAAEVAEAERLAAFGDALADPLRVRVLGLLAEARKGGRGCCGLPAAGAPEVEGEDFGICVCELEAYFGLAQSKISYHLRKLVRAGLVREEKRGRWNYYSLNIEAANSSLSGIARYLYVDW